MVEPPEIRVIEPLHNPHLEPHQIPVLDPAQGTEPDLLPAQLRGFELPGIKVESKELGQNMVPRVLPPSNDPALLEEDLQLDTDTLQVVESILAPFKRKTEIVKNHQSDPDAMLKISERLTDLDSSMDQGPCNSSLLNLDSKHHVSVFQHSPNELTNVDVYEECAGTEQMSPDSQLSPTNLLTNQVPENTFSQAGRVISLDKPCDAQTGSGMSVGKNCDLYQTVLARPTQSSDIYEDVPPKPSHILPPCRVCGDKASGFHYGANTCEACKVSVEQLNGVELVLSPDSCKIEIDVSETYELRHEKTNRSDTNWSVPSQDD